MNFISKLVSNLEVTSKDTNGLTTEPQEYLRQQPTELLDFIVTISKTCYSIIMNIALIIKAT